MTTNNDVDPLVSIIITTYNEDEFIQESIEALLNQSLSDFEIIIVDDGSEDETVEIIESINSDLIQLFKLEHRGHYPALNTALSNSRGEFIAKVDPDDLPREDRLQKQVEFLQKNPKVAVVGSAYQAINSIRNEKYVRRYPTNDSEIKKELTKYIPIPHSSMMFRKAALEQVGFYNDNLDYLGEVELLLRIGAKYKLANIDEPLITRQIRSDSSFHSEYSDFARSIKLLQYNLQAVSTFELPVWYYYYPILSFIYNFLPNRLKIKARKYFSRIDRDS